MLKTIIVITIVAVLVVVLVAFFFLKLRKKKEPTIISEISFTPSSTKAFNLLAEGKGAAALEEFKKLIAQGVVTIDIYTTMGNLYRQFGEVNKAIYINEGLLLKKDLPEEKVKEIIKELIVDYYIVGNVGKAYECIERVERNMTFPELELLKAKIAEFNNDPSEALKYYSKYEKASGQSTSKEQSMIYYNNAIENEDSGKKIKALKNAVDIDKTNRYAYFELAKEYLADGKKNAVIEEINNIIQLDLIRTREDMRRIQDIYYQCSTLDELYKVMLEKISSNSESPAPYLYASTYNRKKGELDKASEILKAYIENYGKKAIVIKEFLRILKDPFLTKLLRNDDFYYCKKCNAKFEEYVTVCTNCAGVDTLDYL